MSGGDSPSRSIREAVRGEAIELLGEIDGEGVAPSGDTTGEGERPP